MFLLVASLLSLSLIFVCSRFVIGEVTNLAGRLHSSSFAVSFLLLGFLTSLTEVSVAINAQLDGHPDIYAGDLIGGSFVIILLIVPILALLRRGGLPLDRRLPARQLATFLAVISLPVAFAFNGVIGSGESLAMILIYLAFIFSEFFSKQAVKKVSTAFGRHTAWSFFKIAVAGAGIFASCHYLVLGTESLAAHLGIPAFIVSVVLLSIGTNIPEITLAITSVFNKKSDVAFGDYVGSASFNVFLLGIFSLFNGPYILGLDGSLPVFVIFLVGNVILLWMGVTQGRISRFTAGLLIMCYAAALSYQAWLHF